MGKIIVTQIKSGIDRPFTQKRTLKALGLNGINQTIQVEGTPQVMGMVAKVRHLLDVKNA